MVALCAGLGIGYFATRSGESRKDRLGTDPRTAQSSASAAGPGATSGFAIAPLPADADVTQILARIRAEKNPNRQRQQLDEMTAALDAPAIQALLAGMGKKFLTGEFERQLFDALMTRWAEIDPRAAAEYAVLQGRKQQLIPLHSVMAVWARSDLAAAKAWTLSKENRQGRGSGINAIVEVLVETDPAEAFAFLEGLPATENLAPYMYGLFETLAQKNPTQAAELAVQIDALALRQAAVLQVAMAWGQTEPGKALAWYYKNQARDADSDLGMNEPIFALAKNWTRIAPEEAAAFAAAQPSGSTRLSLTLHIAMSWGNTDPEATAKWLLTQPINSGTDFAFEALLSSWSGREPAKAGDFVLSQPPGPRRNELLGSLGSLWAESDPTAALAWAQQQNVPEMELRVVAPALGAMAAKDLPNVDRYLAQLKTPEARIAAIQAVSFRNSRQDAPATAQWLTQIAQSQPIGQALDLPISIWARSDPDALGAWLNQQPASTHKDAALGIFSGELAEKDGPAAVAWATSITDAKIRDRRLAEVVGTWAEKDRTAARAWVATQNLTPAQRQKLLERLEP